MDKALQDAIKEVAEYDGRRVDEKCNYFINYDGDEFLWDMPVSYHTSADALLPVWRKVRNEVQNAKYDYWWVTGIERVGQLILDNNLPEAVIKLANIIEQIKQR